MLKRIQMLRAPVAVWWLDGLKIREGVCRRVNQYPAGRCFVADTPNNEKVEIFEDDVFFCAADAGHALNLIFD